MEEELVSKKDLLELTGISYGQLYRWKRKGLIPDDWFVRKSTFTGQETFFPKAKVLSRIDKILSMKEDVSLDDLKDVFSPGYQDISLEKDEVIKRGIAGEDIVKIYLDFTGSSGTLGFNDILSIYLLNKHMLSGDLSLSEGQVLLEVLREGLIRYSGKPCDLIAVRKLGVFCCFMTSPPVEICTDSAMRVIAKINIQSVIEEFKLLLF
jgi:hypothetical protein